MTINFGKKTVYTRSLMIADLSKEESLKLQEEGVGGEKLYGCGIFLPHKSIDAVNNFKEDWEFIYNLIDLYFVVY